MNNFHYKEGTDTRYAPWNLMDGVETYQVINNANDEILADGIESEPDARKQAMKLALENSFKDGESTVYIRLLTDGEDGTDILALTYDVAIQCFTWNRYSNLTAQWVAA